MEDDLLNEGYAAGKDANQTLKRMQLIVSYNLISKDIIDIASDKKELFEDYSLFPVKIQTSSQKSIQGSNLS